MGKGRRGQSQCFPIGVQRDSAGYVWPSFGLSGGSSSTVPSPHPFSLPKLLAQPQSQPISFISRLHSFLCKEGEQGLLPLLMTMCLCTILGETCSPGGPRHWSFQAPQQQPCEEANTLSRLEWGAPIKASGPFLWVKNLSFAAVTALVEFLEWKMGLKQTVGREPCEGLLLGVQRPAGKR